MFVAVPAAAADDDDDGVGGGVIPQTRHGYLRHQANRCCRCWSEEEEEEDDDDDDDGDDGDDGGGGGKTSLSRDARRHSGVKGTSAFAFLGDIFHSHKCPERMLYPNPLDHRRAQGEKHRSVMWAGRGVIYL